jgi:hypothetical protein
LNVVVYIKLNYGIAPFVIKISMGMHEFLVEMTILEFRNFLGPEDFAW